MLYKIKVNPCEGIYDMAKLKISIGDHVEISQLNQNEGLQPYVSVVGDFDNKSTVLINTPISSGAYVRLPKNEEYSIKFINKKGIFRINASINKYISKGNIQFIELKLLGESERIQQRDFFRLSCSIPLNFQISIENESEIQFSDEMHTGIIQDLSGGGIRMLTKAEIAAYELIKFNLQLDDNIYELTGEIIFKTHNPYTALSYAYGVMFLGLSEADREKIVIYLHHTQLKPLQ